MTAMLRRETPFRLRDGRGGETIYGDLRSPSGDGPFPTVIVCHSFMAFKDWGFFPHVGRRLADAGFASVTFNFSQNGAGPGIKITDRGAFERNTISRELSDLGAVIDAVGSNELVQADPGRIALLGHSRGAGIGIVVASRDARVRALVSWAPIATFDRWTRHQKEQWRAAGYLPMAKDPSALRLGLELLEEIEHDPVLSDLAIAAGAVRVPWLIVQGRADVTVHPDEAERLQAASDGAELVMVEGAGHLFHAGTYAEEHYRTLDGIIGRTTQWLKQHL